MLRPILICLSALFCMSCDAPPEETPPTPQITESNTGKRIALTYDDGPRSDGRVFSGAERTEALIEQFEIAGTGPVAMFVTTRGLDREDGSGRIHAYADAGHRIANHSHSHSWASQTELDAYIADIDQAEVALEPFANRRAWFRFPYLDEGGYGEPDVARLRRDALRTALAERDIMSGYVTIDTFDWHLDRLWQDALRDGKTIDEAALSQVYVDMVVDAAEHFDRMALDSLDRRPAQVVLLHENDLAASFTVDMVSALRSKGWTIIDPDEAFSDPIAAQLPDTLFSGMGRIAALATDEGRSGAEYFDHWSASESGIEERLAAHAVFTD